MPSKHPYKRAERVSDVIRQVVSQLLVSRVHHEGLEGVTVTGVKMTDDLQHARVFYRVFDMTKRVEIARKLRDAGTFLRKEVSHAMDLKFAPRLTFEYDESLEYGARIETLLDGIKKQGPGEEE